MEIKNFLNFSKNENIKIIYYTQNFIDKNKVNRLSDIINNDWIEKNPIAFEVYKKNLYLTEGHHRFEACLKLKDKELIKLLLKSALYYNINYEPIYYKKVKVYL